jgi:hypothetical protein
MFYHDMPLQEIEFELTADQYEVMNYPGLRQGQPLSLLLDGGSLFPDPITFTWYAVRPEPLVPQCVRTGPGQYALAGQIREAEIGKVDGQERAVLLVDCGGVPVRVTCLPQDDGTLPWGTWETRWLTGHTLLAGIVEDDFASGIGEMVGVTIWHFRRLVLTPGDPHFGEWVEADELLPLPFGYDRILVTARVHRRGT